MQIDLNCDLGEGCPHDAALMPLITSANVSCGGHAGDPATLMAALKLAKSHGVQVGAHPGYPDRENFGRRELAWSAEEVYQACVYQIGALLGLAGAVGVPVRYVKPHGALYNQACRDPAFAQPVLQAARTFGLAVMGLPASCLAAATHEAGVRFIAEGFADRRYQPDGSLVPRGRPDAFLHDPGEAVAQVRRLIDERGVETICVHGDNPQALDFVRALREFLLRAKFEIRAFGMAPSEVPVQG